LDSVAGAKRDVKRDIDKRERPFKRPRHARNRPLYCYGKEVNAVLRDAASLLRSKIEEAEIHPEALDIVAYKGLLAGESESDLTEDETARFIDAVENAISDVEQGVY
jgi:hypothetical protein